MSDQPRETVPSDKELQQYAAYFLEIFEPEEQDVFNALREVRDRTARAVRRETQIQTLREVSAMADERGDKIHLEPGWSHFTDFVNKLDNQADELEAPNAQR